MTNWDSWNFLVPLFSFLQFSVWKFSVLEFCFTENTWIRFPITDRSFPMKKSLLPPLCWYVNTITSFQTILSIWITYLDKYFPKEATMTLIRGKASRYSLAFLWCVFILVVATYNYNNHLFAIFWSGWSELSWCSGWSEWSWCSVFLFRCSG